MRFLWTSMHQVIAVHVRAPGAIIFRTMRRGVMITGWVMDGPASRSSRHVPCGYNTSTSPILIVLAVLWTIIGGSLFIGGTAVHRRCGRMGHLGNGSVWTVHSPRWKPSRSRHSRCLRYRTVSLLFFRIPSSSRRYKVGVHYSV